MLGEQSSAGGVRETYVGGGNSLTTAQVVKVGGAVSAIAFERSPDGVFHVYTGGPSGDLRETYWGGGNTLTSYTRSNLGSSITSMDSLFS